MPTMIIRNFKPEELEAVLQLFYEVVHCLAIIPYPIDYELTIYMFSDNYCAICSNFGLSSLYL